MNQFYTSFKRGPCGLKNDVDRRVQNESSSFLPSLKPCEPCIAVTIWVTFGRTTTRIADKITVKSITRCPYIDSADLGIKTSD